MNNKRHFSFVAIIGITTACVALVMMALAGTVQRADAGLDALVVDQQVYGQAELIWGTAGVLSHTLTAPTAAQLAELADYGSVDLGILLQKDASQTNGAIGYVNLDPTMIFTAEHSIDATLLNATTTEQVGPAVSGTFDGTALDIVSERVSHVMADGKQVERQFSLTGTGTADGMTGEYRETLWGYTVQPLTIVGEFTVQIVESPESVPTSVGLLGFGDGGISAEIIILTLLLATALAATSVIYLKKR